MVIDNEYSGKPIASIGIEPPAEMQNGKTFKASFNNVIGPATDSVIPHTQN